MGTGTGLLAVIVPGVGLGPGSRKQHGRDAKGDRDQYTRQEPGSKHSGL
jgi:hypothetical protein